MSWRPGPKEQDTHFHAYQGLPLRGPCARSVYLHRQAWTVRDTQGPDTTRPPDTGQLTVTQSQRWLPNDGLSGPSGVDVVPEAKQLRHAAHEMVEQCSPDFRRFRIFVRNRVARLAEHSPVLCRRDET